MIVTFVTAQPMALMQVESLLKSRDLVQLIQSPNESL